MKELIRNQEHMYSLYEDGSRLIIEVLCGGIGMFEVKVVLDKDECDKYAEKGEIFLNTLASDIARDHKRYSDRIIL